MRTYRQGPLLSASIRALDQTGMASRRIAKLIRHEGHDEVHRLAINALNASLRGSSAPRYTGEANPDAWKIIDECVEELGRTSFYA